MGLDIAVALALAFAITNGFHDAANAIATLVATRAARPGPAIVMSATFNMIGALDLPGRPAEQPPVEAQEREPEAEPERGRDGEDDQHPDDADGLDAVHPSPVDRVASGLCQRGANQPTHQRVTRAGGRPRDQVRRFHTTPASTAEPITATASDGWTVTIPAIVFATAVPSRSAPIMLKVADMTIAGPGRAARVATSVAIAFAAS